MMLFGCSEIWFELYDCLADRSEHKTCVNFIARSTDKYVIYLTLVIQSNTTAGIIFNTGILGTGGENNFQLWLVARAGGENSSLYNSPPPPPTRVLQF